MWYFFEEKQSIIFFLFENLIAKFLLSINLQRSSVNPKNHKKRELSFIQKKLAVKTFRTNLLIYQSSNHGFAACALN